MNKIVVTGALGHIGSRLVRGLAGGFPGTEIVLVDNLSTQRYCSLLDLPDGGRFRFLELDVTTADLTEAFRGADAVVHLAAITDAAGSFEQRERVEHHNFHGTRRVAEAALGAGARLLHLSSTSVYGSAAAVVDETCAEDDLRPQSPYAATKLREERLLERMAGDGLRFVVCRFGTICGVSPGMRFHTAVNKFCWQAVLGTPLTVWRTALDQKRPYLDLEDAIDAVRFILRRDLFDGRVYNVVTQNLTVREVVDAIREHVPSVAVELVEAAIMNQLSYEVSAARLAAAGFEPRGDVRRAIADTIGRLRGANTAAERVVETATPRDRPAGTMYTREQFEALRTAWARELAADRALVRDARDLLGRADRHNWVHQGSWFGEPLLNLPQDVLALQDVIWRTRPRRIVEVGVAWGGSLLFYAGLLEAMGLDDAEVIGVDVYVPDDLRARIAAHERLARRIRWVVGSSTAPETLAEVRRLVGDHGDVLVVLDSDHTHAHVLAELRAYAPLVRRGHYLVCCDTIVEDLPTQAHRPRAWGPGNNPATALRAFLAEQTRFAVDEALDNRLLLTCNAGGYLRAGADPE